MAKNWVVSTHAAAYSSGPARTISLTRLPNGVRFYFFEDEGVALAVDKAWKIYDLLMKPFRTAQDYVAVSKIPGYRMFDKPALPNYKLTGDDSWIDPRTKKLASGIFVLGDTYHKDPETLYIQNGQWYSLSEFLSYGTWMPGDQVYWLACRSWM